MIVVSSRVEEIRLGALAKTGEFSRGKSQMVQSGIKTTVLVTTGEVAGRIVPSRGLPRLEAAHWETSRRARCHGLVLIEYA
jgi:hypothetical protein